MSNHECLDSAGFDYWRKYIGRGRKIINGELDCIVCQQFIIMYRIEQNKSNLSIMEQNKCQFIIYETLNNNNSRQYTKEHGESSRIEISKTIQTLTTIYKFLEY